MLLYFKILCGSTLLLFNSTFTPSPPLTPTGYFLHRKLDSVFLNPFQIFPSILHLSHKSLLWFPRCHVSTRGILQILFSLGLSVNTDLNTPRTYISILVTKLYQFLKKLTTLLYWSRDKRFLVRPLSYFLFNLTLVSSQL